MKRILALAAVVSLILLPIAAIAAAPDGPTIITTMKKAFEPEIASTKKVVSIIGLHPATEEGPCKRCSVDKDQ